MGLGVNAELSCFCLRKWLTNQTTFVLCEKVFEVLSWMTHLSLAHQAQPVKNATLDQGTVQMLSSILDSLDTFRNDRLRDLEKIRLNTTEVARLDGRTVQMPDNSSVSEHIRALKEGIMGHNPVKKTFGYKVTVYTSPIGEDGKDAKPVMVTQYVGGDMKPMRRADESDDLQESANHPDRQLVHSSESAHLPIQVSQLLASGGGESANSHADLAKGAKDRHRTTEHSESSEKGHQNGHSLATTLAKGHDHERHSAKSDKHHKETEKESHRHDEQQHDKGGATQQGIRERTEIEYYEREHFLDTEFDAAKRGHDKTSGLKEHQAKTGHDSHENTRVYDQDNIHNHRVEEGAHKAAIGTHESAYVPPLPYPDPHHKDLNKDALSSSAAHLDSGSSKLHHSEASKGAAEHSDVRDLQKEERDQGYSDSDKGRRKEGYRERGYKITAEREYFLNDAHHDKGSASHTSGHKLKDEEGAAHASKEGERDRGFVKETKEEEAHDAAYEAKDKKYRDGEEQQESFVKEGSASSSTAEGGKEQKEEVVPLAPPVVNYVEPDPHYHSSLYPPLPIVYSPSNDGAQAVLAYPPADLKPPKTSVQVPHVPVNRDVARKQSQPIGGYDDDENLESSTGYRGHASYRKRPSPLVASIRDNVRKDVHSKPPSYAKEETSAENSVPNSGNSVRFPEEESKSSAEMEEERSRAYQENSRTHPDKPSDFEQERRRPDSKDVYYQKNHQDHSNEQYGPPKHEAGNRRPPTESKEVYFHKETHSDPNEPYRPKKDVVYLEDSKRNRPQDHPDLNPDEQYRLIPPKKDVVYLEDSKRNRPQDQNPNEPYSLKKDVVYLENTKRNRPPRTENHHHLHSHRPREQNSRLLYVQGAQNADKLLRTVDRSVYPQIQNGEPGVKELIQEVARYPQAQEVQHYSQRNPNGNAELSYDDIHQLYHPNSERNTRNQQKYSQPLPTQQQQPQSHQQHLIAKYNQLIQQAKQQNGEAVLDLLRNPDLLHLKPTTEQQRSELELLQQQQQQQQTKPPFSPVVLLSRGPSSQQQNQAVNVWYTRPRS
ncbi:hypothetical protein JTE90_010902 [Oedothorax gibbosus]|uniref:Uncharacterized protein n=1 Tax=Oedothorax gibbosus TaxID=931172 RepID=A0AAV6UFY2_9ARAC|nr:hypothetical protein JTE90_010902 [Oedothorax gibbosus]